MSRRVELAQLIAELREKKSALQASLDTLNEQLEQAEEEMVLVMEAESLQSFKDDNLKATFYLSGDAYCSIEKPEVAYSWLREHGLGAIIKESIHASTLRATFKDWLEKNGEEIPGIKATYFNRLNVRKYKEAT